LADPETQDRDQDLAQKDLSAMLRDTAEVVSRRGDGVGGVSGTEIAAAEMIE